MNMMKTTGIQFHRLQGQDVSVPSACLDSHLANVHSDEVCQSVPGSSSNLMDANSQANLMLQPKSGSKCYLKIVDFVIASSNRIMSELYLMMDIHAFILIMALSIVN